MLSQSNCIQRPGNQDKNEKLCLQFPKLLRDLLLVLLVIELNRMNDFGNLELCFFTRSQVCQILALKSLTNVLSKGIFAEMSYHLANNGLWIACTFRMIR